MGRERKARILKSEYLLLNASERLRDYDKYEKHRGRQREIEMDMEKEAEEGLSVFPYPFLVSVVDVRPIWEDNYEKSSFDGELWNEPPGYNGEDDRSGGEGACGGIPGPGAVPGVYKQHDLEETEIGVSDGNLQCGGSHGADGAGRD